MVKAWYMDSDTNDQRLEHQRKPPEFITLEDLYKKTGVEYFKIARRAQEKRNMVPFAKKATG